MKRRQAFKIVFKLWRALRWKKTTREKAALKVFGGPMSFQRGAK